VAAVTSGKTRRYVVMGVCVVVILALFAIIVRQSLVINGDDRHLVREEQEGAAMLHPLTAVLGDLVAAQSAAVRGEAVNAAALLQGLASVATEDEVHGAGMGTHSRFTDFRSQLEAQLKKNETGRAAFVSYSSLVTLAVDLMKQIGERSNLFHDPDLDSYYLMDAAVIRLPIAVTLAGRASDLSALALASGKPLQGEDAISAAVARFGVSDAAEQVDAGLTVTVASTSRAELGGNIASSLDTFKDAADAFSPPTMLLELSSTVDASTLAANAHRVSAAATPLAHRLLYELQELLDARAARLASDLRITILATAVVLLLLLVLAYMVAVGGPRPLPTVDDSTDLPQGVVAPGAVARHRGDSDDLVGAGRSSRWSREAGDAQ
jgi:hypothetical protein